MRFFGTRGSIATPGPQTLRYGGNTSCIEVRSKSGTLAILDMGTGAAGLGRELMARGEPLSGHILISHTHWDHIQGIPFFAPLFAPGFEWDIYAPRGIGQSLRQTLAGQMQSIYFPVAIEQLGATIRYHELVEGRLRIGDIDVTTRYLNHPTLTLGYRLEADDVAFVYACDHEPHSRGLATGVGDIFGEDRRHAEFLAGANLVAHDAQYLASEYPRKIGWGHSTIEYAFAVARLAQVEQLALTHHDPIRDDAAIDAIVDTLRSDSLRMAGPHILAAAEGHEVDLSPRTFVAAAKPRFLGEASLVTALVGRSALVAMAKPSRIDELSDFLRADEVHVHRCGIEDAPGLAEREGPMLMLLEDTGDDRAAKACHAIRRLRGGDDLPIVLVTSGDHGASERHAHAGAVDDAFTDILMQPYSPIYARARIRAWLMRAACRWVRPSEPNDEERRLAATRALGLWQTAPEERFDRITRVAAAALDVPIALIALMDRDREWFKSCFGLEIREVHRDDSFCGHAIFQREPLVVSDALLDERFADNPYVTGAPGVRFYAGHPLILGNGCCVGTLAILDIKPRHFDNSGLSVLHDLAQLAIGEIERPKGV
ncbi:GAF domain-containing protein [Reyranella soli]|nr:MBL fold metallo-hydrolase [Reyranella soli]